MLNIYIPNTCPNEQRYALSILLGEFLGLDFEVSTHAAEKIIITRMGSGQNSEKSFSLDATFFNLAHQHWLAPASMPGLPLQHWNPADDGLMVDLVDPSVPVLYGQPGLVRTADHWHLNLDIFGSVFFMLSRYEELITPERDNHDRFPATASVAYRAGFIDRPLVNEYLEILWACMQGLWGGQEAGKGLARKTRQFRKFISCDVDHPFDHAGYSLSKTVKRMAARVLRDRNPKLAVLDGLNYCFKKMGSDRFDSYRNNIEWLLQVNKAAGNTVAFYFIPVQTSLSHEDANAVDDPKLINLIKHIIDTGHEVGMHPGYNTYDNPKNFNRSAQTFKSILNSQGIAIAEIGGRHHYLRYDVSVTPGLWAENGFAYDSSLGYADKAGFRTGSCYEYSMYDLAGRQPLRLKQRPLIVMDCTIVSKQYEGLGFTEAAKARFHYFEEVCKRYRGDFALLWHNSFFIDKKAKRFYRELIGG